MIVPCQKTHLTRLHYCILLLQFLQQRTLQESLSRMAEWLTCIAARLSDKEVMPPKEIGGGSLLVMGFGLPAKTKL